MKLRRQRKNQWCVFVPNWLKNDYAAAAVWYKIYVEKKNNAHVENNWKTKKIDEKCKNSWRGISVCIAFASVA